jgi:chemotaxis protein histidine kinase CheA
MATSDATLGVLSRRWHAMTEHIASVSGLTGQRSIEIPEAEYTALLSRLSSAGSTQRELLDQVSAWRLEPVRRPFERIAEQAKALARRLDKGEIRVEVEPNDVRVDPDAFGPLFAELIHVIRNAVDHGLETPDEREACHKPPQGKLVLKAAASVGIITFEISDDGRGIDWDAIAEAARARGLPHATKAELLDVLCSDGVTTRKLATSDSGRGVGMAALKQRVERMHGRLEVNSTRGVGTCFSLRFPVSREDASQRSRRPFGGDSSRTPLSQE